MTDDIEGKFKNSIEILPENLSVGRELTPGDAISQIGEKTGFNDQHVKEMFPKLKGFGGTIHFENIKDTQRKNIGIFMIGKVKGSEKFRYKILYINGKYVRQDNIASTNKVPPIPKPAI